MRTIKIGGKTIGNRDPFVIAEAGVNHNGSLDLALKLVDAAKVAGADAIKFQTFKAEQVVTGQAEMAEYQRKNTGGNGSQLLMLKKLELEEEFYPQIIARCLEKDIIFLSTPHGGFESVDLLNGLDVPAFKFGSGDLTNLPVLRYSASFRKPMILGTGASNLKEVSEAVDCIKKTGNNQIILLHCTSDYPCPEKNVNLKAMLSLREKFNLHVGYSDHTLGHHVAVVASALGACLIEKHFTIDKNLLGPDHRTSAEPEDLRNMIRDIKSVRILMGSFAKKPTKQEIKTRKIIRKSLVALLNIKKGESFSSINVGIKRPGVGLEPKYFFKILGRKSKRNIKKDTLIKKNDFI